MLQVRVRRVKLGRVAELFLDGANVNVLPSSSLVVGNIPAMPWLSMAAGRTTIAGGRRVLQAILRTPGSAEQSTDIGRQTLPPARFSQGSSTRGSMVLSRGRVDWPG